MGKSNPVIARIADPYPSTLQQLDNVSRQVNLLTANIIGEPQLGTLTAAKKHSSAKIFIVGFIPPSIPTNYVPIQKRFSEASLRSAASVVNEPEAAGEGVIEEQENVKGLLLSERKIASIMQNKAIMIYSGVTRYEAEDPNYIRLKKNVRVADGRRREIADRQIKYLREQIQAISNIPPLIFLVNPREFNRDYEQAVDNSPKGRFGHIVHSWLERPMKISASGVSAGQYVINAAGSGGITAEHRVHSLSYHNLMSLLMTYKNNGIIFAGVGTERGIPIIAFSLYIYYDNHIYIGSFDDFSIDDKADSPFNLGYSFKFNVRYDMDIDSSHLVESAIFAPDPRVASKRGPGVGF